MYTLKSGDYLKLPFTWFNLEHFLGGYNFIYLGWFSDAK